MADLIDMRSMRRHGEKLRFGSNTGVIELLGQVDVDDTGPFHPYDH